MQSSHRFTNKAIIVLGSPYKKKPTLLQNFSYGCSYWGGLGFSLARTQPKKSLIETFLELDSIFNDQKTKEKRTRFNIDIRKKKKKKENLDLIQP